MLDAAVDVAEALTVAGREQEAIALARPAVDVARDTGRGETLRWALLVLATAEHYADEPVAAEAHFREALDHARTSGDRVLEHYTLHHVGRFLVDAGRTDEAVACFEACLAIREDSTSLGPRRTRRPSPPSPAWPRTPEPSPKSLAAPETGLAARLGPPWWGHHSGTSLRAQRPKAYSLLFGVPKPKLL